VGAKTPQNAVGIGAGQFTVTRVTVTTAATQLVGANANRQEVIFIKGSNKEIFLGPDSGLTIGNGALFSGGKGSAFGLSTTDAVFGIVAGGTLEVHIIELIET